MTEVQEKAGNYTSSASEQLDTCLAQLSTDQLRFVIARQEFSTDKDAAESIDLGPTTVYHWPSVVKEAVRLMAADGLHVARHLRCKNLAKAMLVKVQGLDSDDEALRQRVATEIVEWEMGKAQESLDLTTKGDRLLADARTELQRRIDRLADTRAPGGDSDGSAAGEGDGAAL